MMYYIWDNDNAVMVCATESRKEAFTAVLNHLIEANCSEVPDPIMWPVAAFPNPNEQMPDTRLVSEDGWSLIRQAQDAYNKIVGLIPMP
ncbi:MAG: hypothetical protein HFH27_07285 [Clostridiaceae bacterium]|nr:hypothetical protein [Clostridiaceae bacterium]